MSRPSVAIAAGFVSPETRVVGAAPPPSIGDRITAPALPSVQYAKVPSVARPPAAIGPGATSVGIHASISHRISPPGTDGAVDVVHRSVVPTTTACQWLPAGEATSLGMVPHPVR